MTNSGHRLTAVESSFLDPDWYADCLCGWRSDGYPRIEDAEKACREHVKDEAIVVAQGQLDEIQAASAAAIAKAQAIVDRAGLPRRGLLR